MLRDIAARGGVKRYPAHAVIINEGDDADSLFVILTGRVKVYASNEARKEVILNHHGPGEFVVAHPVFALQLIHHLIRRLRDLTGSVKSLALEDVYGRVVALLPKVSVPQGAVRVVGQRMTQQDIAEHVGASREMVSRIFKDLVAGGLVAARRAAQPRSAIQSISASSAGTPRAASGWFNSAATA